MFALGEPLLVVASLSRPGGNVTGLSTFANDLAAKRVELMKELVPKLARIAFLHNMGNPVAPPAWEETRAAAESIAVEPQLLDQGLRRSESRVRGRGTGRRRGADRGPRRGDGSEPHCDRRACRKPPAADDLSGKGVRRSRRTDRL